MHIVLAVVNSKIPGRRFVPILIYIVPYDIISGTNFFICPSKLFGKTYSAFSSIFSYKRLALVYVNSQPTWKRRAFFDGILNLPFILFRAWNVLVLLSRFHLVM